MKDGKAFTAELGRLMEQRVIDSLNAQHANLSVMEERQLIDLALERMAAKIFQHFYANDWL